MNRFQASQPIPVIYVPLNERGDYDDIHYSPEFQWTDADRKAIESTVNKFYNSFNPKGEEIVETCFGKIIIKHQLHPNADRRKLIQGFFMHQLSEAMEASSHSLISEKEELDFFTLLENLVPVSMRNDKRSLTDFNKLLEDVKSSAIPEDKLQSELFDALLNSIESASTKYISDEFSKKRLCLLVQLVKLSLSEISISELK
ncbi:hypothetical protein C7B76_23470 [filamentous cyanobacterium CCP2]|nr:hypothetical protein C7B76_23470 [filamentous cyanobacterium CCP2]